MAAPEAGRVIARAAPMLGMLPDTQDAPAINAALAIPLEPGRPAWCRGARADNGSRRDGGAKDGGDAGRNRD